MESPPPIPASSALDDSILPQTTLQEQQQQQQQQQQQYPNETVSPDRQNLYQISESNDEQDHQHDHPFTPPPTHQHHSPPPPNPRSSSAAVEKSSSPDSFYNPKITSRKLLEQFLVTATYLFIGIAELIVSIVLIVRSNRVFIGGIVPGALAIVIGIIGLVIDQKHDHVWFLFSTLVLVCALLYSVLQGISFGQVNQLEACAEYTNELIVSCQGEALGYYECTGNTDYYSNAQYCTASYEGGEEDQVCGCVRSESSSVCVMFNGITDCSILIDEVPELLLTSLIFSVFLTLIALMSFIIRLYYFPPSFQGVREEENQKSPPLPHSGSSDGTRKFLGFSPSSVLPNIEEENEQNTNSNPRFGGGLDSPSKMVSDDSELRYKPTIHEIQV